MGGIYSTRFILSSEPSESLEFTVPSGKVAVVRDVDVVGDAATTVELILAITRADTTTTAFWGVLDSSPSPIFNHQWRGRQVAYAGETIVLTVVTDGSIGSAVSGYLLAA